MACRQGARARQELGEARIGTGCQRVATLEAMTMLADAPIKVPLPPKQAPKARAHASGRMEMPSTASTICIITGTMVAVKGMLSTNAWHMCCL